MVKELRAIKYSDVFVSLTDNKKHISNMTINSGLRRMGYTGGVMVGHGFRATARTLLDEKLSFNPLWIEAQLNQKQYGTKDKKTNLRREWTTIKK